MVHAPLQYDNASADDFRRLRQRLGEIGYAPGPVADMLGLRDPDGIYPLDYRYLPRWDDHLGSKTDDLSPSVRLLLLGLPIDKGLMEKSLGVEQTGFLVATGLAYESGGTLHPRLSIVPFENLLVAADRLFMNADPEGAEQGLSSDNCIWRLDRTTLYMSRAIKERKAGHALELGCGSGVLTLLTAKDAEKVTGVDINPRAVNVARFNARLNGVDNVEFLQGDLYQPVEGGKFDLIFSNPPSAPGLVRAWNREGGATGREMVEGMLRRLEEHLEPGGTFQTTMHFGYREKSDIGSWVGKYVDPGLSNISYELAGDEEDTESYALREAWQKSGPRDYVTFARTYKLYLENLQKSGIEKISFGLLTVERR